MILLSHPTGNANVRQALAALRQATLLDRFHTTVYWDSDWPINRWLPDSVRSELNRRSYPQVLRGDVSLTPMREVARLLAIKFGLTALVESDRAPLSATCVYKTLVQATESAVQLRL